MNILVFSAIWPQFSTKMVKYQRSNRNNQKRKLTQFRKGHKIIKLSSDTYTSSKSTSADKTIKRPKIQEFKDAVKIQSESSWDLNTNILPSKLRPIKEEKQNNINSDIGFISSNESEENIIVNLEKLSDIIKAFLPHSCDNPSPSLDIVKRQGLCVSVHVKCLNCSFCSTKVDLFTTYKPKRGPNAGVLNASLLIPVLKSKVGLSDIDLILSCLNIKPPNRAGMQCKLNRISDLVVDMNKKTMIENQHYVRQVLDLAGESNFVDVEVDSSYNNRPQAGYEAASQSFCPLIEQMTDRKLPLNIETANTICSSSSSCQHNNETCKKNYSTDESLASSEAKFISTHLDKVNTAGIVKVRSVISDACAQTEKAVREYSNDKNIPTRHYKCFIHKMRTFQKHVRNIKLTSTLPGCKKDIFIRKLSNSLRARVRVELIRVKRNSRNENHFVSFAQTAIDNILPCFGNDHDNCLKHSFLCTAHLSSYRPSHLPYGKHLELNQSDIKRIKTVINNNFGPNELKKISRLSTTNQCESLHHKVFTYAPKNTIWTRNFTGLCHSAAHSSSVGNGRACILLARAIGLKYKKQDPFIQEMTKVERLSKYHSARKRTHQYKMARYLSKLKKSNRALRENSIFQTENKQLINEHGYALRT